MSAYRAHSVHIEHYGSFNRWSKQLLPAQCWFTVARKKLNDYKARQLLTHWSAVNNVIGSGSFPMGKMHERLCANISICRDKCFWNIITVSKSSLEWGSRHVAAADFQQLTGLTSSKVVAYNSSTVHVGETCKHSHKQHIGVQLQSLLTGGACSRK